MFWGRKKVCLSTCYQRKPTVFLTKDVKPKLANSRVLSSTKIKIEVDRRTYAVEVKCLVAKKLISRHPLKEDYLNSYFIWLESIDELVEKQFKKVAEIPRWAFYGNRCVLQGLRNTQASMVSYWFYSLMFSRTPYENFQTSFPFLIQTEFSIYITNSKELNGNKTWILFPEFMLI